MTSRSHLAETLDRQRLVLDAKSWQDTVHVLAKKRYTVTKLWSRLRQHGLP
jgi:hypothetical protein